MHYILHVHVVSVVMVQAQQNNDHYRSTTTRCRYSTGIVSLEWYTCSNTDHLLSEICCSNLELLVTQFLIGQLKYKHHISTIAIPLGMLS